MDDDALLLSQIDDRLNRCINRCMLTNTNFLDSYQQSTAKKYLSNINTVRYEFYGGFEDSERKILVFIPEYIEDFTVTDNPLSALRIDKDGFSELSHRDYLGALMGLGIKREMLGDIFVDEKGCVISVISGIAEYIKENLFSVGRGSVKITLSEGFDSFSRELHFEEKQCFVSSMRADSVISAVFGISRTTAVEKIKASVVFVNDILISKPDSKIPVGAKLVVRGKGKAVIKNELKTTKKGRIAFTAEKYI